MCQNQVLNFSEPLSAILVLKSGMPCIKHVSTIQLFKCKYLERNNDTFLSVMLDLYMNDDMSCSICKYCTCMYMFIFEEMT